MNFHVLPILQHFVHDSTSDYSEVIFDYFLEKTFFIYIFLIELIFTRVVSRNFCKVCQSFPICRNNKFWILFN